MADDDKPRPAKWGDPKWEGVPNEPDKTALHFLQARPSTGRGNLVMPALWNAKLGKWRVLDSIRFERPAEIADRWGYHSRLHLPAPFPVR